MHVVYILMRVAYDFGCGDQRGCHGGGGHGNDNKKCIVLVMVDARVDVIVVCW